MAESGCHVANLVQQPERQLLVVLSISNCFVQLRSLKDKPHLNLYAGGQALLKSVLPRRTMTTILLLLLLLVLFPHYYCYCNVFFCYF